MKVLWLSIMPCGANSIVYPNSVLGGWLSSLENALVNEDNLELHECYFCTKPIQDFVHNGVYNYPVYDSFYSSKLFFVLSQLSFLFGYVLADKRIDRMEEIIRKVQPDLIHIHGTESEIGILTTRIKDIPIVVSIQGIINPIENKQYAGIPYHDVSKRDSLLKFFKLTSSQFTKKSWEQYKNRERIIFRHVKYLIGRTNWDRRVTSVLAPQARYFYGGELLRQPFYDAAPWNKTKFEETFTIVSIITNGLFKGYETVLQSAALLSETGFKFRWLIIGQLADAPSIQLFEGYTNINSHDVNIELVGNKTAEELVGIFQRADLYCHVSHIENSPNSVCEAMLLGVPVIATLAGGTDSIIEHGKTGQLFQEGEHYSLAGLITEISANYNRTKQMAETARTTAMMRHDPLKISKQYMEIYHSILS